MATTKTGNEGEDIAAQYLEKIGMTVMDRNYRFGHEELDLVCFEPNEKNDGGEIVFVEVKTRRGRNYGEPEEAVTKAKQRHIVFAAKAYLYERRIEGANCRFDVITVRLGDKDPEITHIRDAFWAN
jgi:putative endonuclease